MKIGFDQVLKNFQWLKNASVLLTASKFAKFSAEAVQFLWNNKPFSDYFISEAFKRKT